MIEHVVMRQATTADESLPWLDHTKMSAINTCPTWGIIKYILNRSPPAPNRNLALETGSACHDVFAAARFASLFETDEHDFAVRCAEKHFGASRHDAMFSRFRSNEPFATRFKTYSLEALATSGYYDDPRDKRRTLQNIEDACVAYLQSYDHERWKPAVCSEREFIGVEVPFNIYMELDHRKFRFVGKADGIINNGHFKQLEVHENKTGSRINDAWAMSFHMSHQVTGYIAAAGIVVPEQLGRMSNACLVHGLQIPLPRNVEIGGIVAERVSRHREQFERWLDWMAHTFDIMDKYKDSPLDAPKYTHSCNRYFQPCALIPLCSEQRENQEIMLYEEYTEQVWNPLVEE